DVVCRMAVLYKLKEGRCDVSRHALKSKRKEMASQVARSASEIEGPRPRSVRLKSILGAGEGAAQPVLLDGVEDLVVDLLIAGGDAVVNQYVTVDLTLGLAGAHASLVAL